MSGQIQIRNDADFRIRGFKDKRTGSYLNAATGTWELRTAKYNGGSQVSTGSMAYVSSSNGEYVGGIDNAISLTEGTTYWLHVTLAEGGVVGDWEIPVVAARRTGLNPIG
jgi:hypothetical protein